MLTASQVKTARPKEKPYRLTDERGLYLLVQPGGGKWWRLDYRYGGKRKTLGLGTWPDTSLALARRKRDDLRAQLAAGTDPAEQRKAEKRAAVETFDAVAADWLATQGAHWTERHQRTTRGRIAARLSPRLGHRPIAEIDAPELLAVLRTVPTPYLAGRLRQIAERIFAHAVGIGAATSNPAAAIKGTLAAPPPVRHRAAIVEPEAFKALYRAICGYTGDPITRCALQLLPLLFTRPGELRAMTWGELSGDTWTIPAAKTKTRRSDLIVPLASDALRILDEIRPHTGHGLHVFPSLRTLADGRRPLSDNTLNAALRRLGYGPDEVTAHGFRAAARTLLVEQLGFRVELVEMQLGHAVADPLGRAYNRAQFLPERRAMMGRWAQYLVGDD